MAEHQAQDQALDLRAYFRPIWRRKWIVLTIVVVATGVTYLIASHQPKVYKANASIYVESADPTQALTASTGAQAPTASSVADVAQLVVSGSSAAAVGRQLGVPEATFSGSVTATPSTTADFVVVGASSHTATRAANLANTYVAVYLRSRRQQVRAAAIADERAARATLSTLSASGAAGAGVDQRQAVSAQIEADREMALNPTAGARQIDFATTPALPSSPRPVRDALFGGVVGLILGAIAAFVIELLDRRLARVATVESVFGRPVLAVLPHVSDAAPTVEGQSGSVPAEFLEELRGLIVMLRLSGSSPAPRTILVTSALPREGKSTVTRALALVYADAGLRVLVIDGDLRRPSVQRLFGVAPEHGLVQLLRGEVALSEAAVPAIRPPDTLNHNGNGNGNGNGLHPAAAGAARRDLPGTVDVIVHGESVDNPLRLLSSPEMFTLLDDAARVYDMILIDTPPVLAVPDSVPLLEVVDSVLLVARLGQTTRQAADRFTDLIDQLTDVTFSGVIANDQQGRSDEDGYSYRGYYAAGRTKRRDRAAARAS